MRVSIIARGFPLTEALRDAIEREANGIRRGLEPRIDHLTLRLYDINGRRGGEDKACRLEARLSRVKTVIATHIHSDMYRAIAGAFEKLDRAARRSVDRARARRCTSAPFSGMTPA